MILEMNKREMERYEQVYRSVFRQLNHSIAKEKPPDSTLS